MRTFDPDTWRRRAWSRFERDLHAECDSKAAERRWYLEVVAIANLELLIGWCASKGIAVAFGKKQNANYDPANKRIVVSCHALPERQLMYMLHECGHHLIGMKEHHQRFGMGYPQSDPAVTRTFLHRVSCLEEELEAWHRGWKLSQRIGLSLSRESFDRIRLECIRSYIKWTLQRSPNAGVEDDSE